MSFDYAFEISILAGGLTGILGFLISYLILNQSKQILSMILGTIVSIALVYIIHFFKLTLDYSGVEYAQFEDDVYYYYVKAVPKVTVTVPQVNVKHINVKSTERREFSDPDVDEAEDYGYDE
jgi:ABC-type branched-subunit amino acid transport system permease subunit